MAKNTITLRGPEGEIISLPTGLFIENQFVPSIDAQILDVKNAASGLSIGLVSAATAKDIDIAVASSRKAYQDVWRHVSAARRRALLNTLADLIERDIDIFATIEGNDVGQLIGTTKHMLGPMSVGWIRYFAGWTDKIEGRSTDWDDGGRPSGLSYTRREPYGVTAAIVPWNTPL
jgi:aldehyde dehydrogenase (NAD+)